MITDAIKRIARSLGVNLCSTDHIGVDVELDLLRLTDSDPLRTVFDVGGNFGQTARLFASSFPAATIFTFEPVPSSFAMLQEAVRDNRRIRPFNLALGDEPGSLSMNITDSAGGNTLLPAANARDSIMIPVDTIDAFVAAQAIGGIDLLKIDVEGYELAVLKGAGKTLERGGVRYVFAECVLLEDTLAPHTSFFDLHRVLAQHGFCFVAYYGESFRLSDGCALGNVLYALKSKLPKKAAGRIANVS